MNTFRRFQRANIQQRFFSKETLEKVGVGWTSAPERRAAGARSGQAVSGRFQRVLRALLQQLGPAALQEAPHAVPGAADLRAVLVELLAVIQKQAQVREEGLRAGVPEDTQSREIS